MKNTFVKVLSMMMALMMVVGMFSMVTVSAAEHECEPTGEPIEIVEATCSKIGYKKYLCECGKEVIADVVPENKGHNYQKVEAKTPTCSEEGNTEGWACADCGDTDSLPSGKNPPVTIEKIPHQWGAYKVNVAKTCTTDAFTTTQCVVCETLNMDPTVVEYKVGTAGHDYEYVVDAELGSCSNGKVTVTCSSCDFVDIIEQAANHNWVPMKTIEGTTDATALKKGFVAGTECKYQWSKGEYCNKCWTPRNTEANTTNGHIKDRLNANDAAIDDAIEHAIIATLDKDNLTAEIAAKVNPATGANFKVGDKTWVAKTCTTDGWYLIFCHDCKTYQFEYDPHPVNGHTPGQWSVWSTTAAGITKTFAKDEKKENIEVSPFHNYVFKQTQLCTACSQTIATRTTTATNHNYENREGDKVLYTNVIPATCYDNGYTIFTCRYGCDQKPWEGDYVVAKGYHSYEAEGATPVWNKVPNYNCASNAFVTTTCTHAECDTNRDEAGYQKAVSDRQAVAGAKHDYKLDPVAGTCMEADYYQQKCANCGDIQPYTGKEVPAGSSIKAGNHVAAYDVKNGVIANYVTKAGASLVSATATTLAPKQALTCTTDKIEYFVCACGERVELVTAKAPGHNWVTGGVEEKPTNVSAVYHAAGCTIGQTGGKCVAGCKNYEPKTPNCVEGGQTAGKLCTTCGQTEVAPTQLGVNPSVHHPDTKNGVTVEYVAPTCKDYGYSVWNCSKCYVKVTETKLNDKGEAYTDANNHANLKTNGIQNPSCVNPGLKAHKFCDGCNNYYNLDGSKTTYANLVIPGAEKHTWVAVSLQYETCDNHGWVAFKYCSVCQGGAPAANYTDVKVVTLDNGKTWTVDNDKTNKAGQNEAFNAIKLDKHGLLYTKNWASLIKYDKDGELIGATCTAGAWIDTPDTVCCVFCYMNADRAVYEKEHKIVGNDNTSALYWEKALGHMNSEGKDAYTPVQYENYILVGTDLKVVDCMKASFVRSECTECGDTKMTNYRPAKAHKYAEPDAKGKYADGKVKTEPATCTEAGYTYLICENGCQVKKELSVLPALGHSYNGEKITFACKDLDKFEGLTCDNCHLTVGAYDADGKLLVEHDPISVKVEATCTTDGYEVTYCAGCDKEYPENNKYDKHKGHDYGTAADKLVKVSETATETVYRCHVCGEDYSVAKAVATPDDIAIVLDAYNTIEGAGKTFTDSSIIALTVALKGAQIGASAINLNVTYSNNLVFAGYEFATGHGFTTFQNAVDNNDDSFDKDGKFVEGKADFVSISAATDFDESKAPVDYVVDGTVQLVTLYFEVNNTESSAADAWVNVTKADIVNQAQKNLKVAANKQFDIKVSMFMDFNGNDAVTMADLLAAAQIFSGALTDKTGAVVTYDVAVDVDKDGEITAADLLTIMNYINGAITYDEVTALKAE